MTAVPKALVRLLVVDPARHADAVLPFARFADHFGPGDLLVVNDAATYPASIRAVTDVGVDVELRVFGFDGSTWDAVVFGAGDWRTKTEDRPAPPSVRVGARLTVVPLTADVVAVHSARHLTLRFDGSLWPHLYAHGEPIQYAYRTQLDPLWAFQNVYAARPWAAENPSAGRPLSWDVLLQLKRRGVRVEALTHATGLSSTGDAALDATMPWPERYEIPAATAEAVASARRVIAVGTSVMRALESSALANGGRVVAGPGVAALRIDETHRPRVTHGLLTGIHSPQESHYALLRSLVDAETLARATADAAQAKLVEHEEGDAALLLPGALSASVPSAS